MKNVLFLFAIILTTTANSMAEKCDDHIVKISLDESASEDCAILNVEGLYQFKTCELGNGILKSQKAGDTNYVFEIDSNVWEAKEDVLDYTNNRITNIVHTLDTKNKSYQMTYQTSDVKGNVLSNFLCKGKFSRE